MDIIPEVNNEPVSIPVGKNVSGYDIAQHSMLSQKSLMPNVCFENIQALVNIKFDQKVFEAFRQSIYIYPTGLPVRLNNNEEGIIVRQNKKYPLRPFVRGLKHEYNLLEHLTLSIEEIML